MSDLQLVTIWCCVQCADNRALAAMPEWRLGWTQDFRGEQIRVMVCPHIIERNEGSGKFWYVNI